MGQTWRVMPNPHHALAQPLCTCDLVKAVHKYKHMDIGRVYSLIVQQEIASPPTAYDSTISFANNINSQGCGRGHLITPMICTHCNKTNHIVDGCYFKHDFPPGYYIKTQATRTNNNSQSDHKTSTPYVSNNGKQDFISREDYQHLTSLLQQSKKDAQKNTSDKNIIADSSHIVYNLINTSITFTNNSIWILDSGASDHVFPHIKCFYDIILIPPIYIHFPNVHTAVANFSGTIHLGTYLHLSNVLYLPEFNFSLISISKL
ncbi:hypothetical protein KIW84_065164 [Lathyrus oleraceus]|uniref:Retrovirus-related Pol polyprotein from transposon TNT 1-94-like beta-barrel domain-containing protein n=1 Tax=Pisum sativum TaxID=3888 RepID=A0A9D4WEN6_PEA|nr:hypothetical protein KIW84_065164 [Pisum sativum]